MSTVPESPVSFPVDVRRLPKKGMPVTVEADEAQRAALALEHDLLAVSSFRADLLVTAWKSGGVQVRGSVSAEIVQACVVTLDPVPSRVDEEVEALFVPEGSRLARPTPGRDNEILLDPDGPDAPDVFSGDEIDVGALAEEFFSLGIDPYPRSPGAARDAGGGEEDRPDRSDSPFARLLSLKTPNR